MADTTSRSADEDLLASFRSFLCAYVNEVLLESASSGPAVVVRSHPAAIVGVHELRLSEVEGEVLDWIHFLLENK